MPAQAPPTLDVIYENWRGYHEKLRDCIAPLTNVRSLGDSGYAWPANT
jgi:hypothetical protein